MLRVLLRSLCALVAAVATALVGWRVLGPAEVVAPAATPYPAPGHQAAGVTGHTSVAPLIVDGRIRVYAAKRQVRADGPANGEVVYTPRWSFRRWPAQLSGVVAVGRQVISRWSDGELVAIDGASGEIVWRASGPSAPGYRGQRTGSATVWQPPGLHVSGGLVVVSGGGNLAGYDSSTGARRWALTVPSGCTDGFTTAGGQYVCPTGAYDVATGSVVASFPAGPYTAVGCEVAASACAGLRDGAGHGWFTSGTVARRVEVLDRPGSTIAAGLVLYRDDGLLRAASPDGTVLRSYRGDEWVLGGSGDKILLCTPGHYLHVVNPRSALGTIADFALRTYDEGRLDWDPGRWQIVGRYLAIERLATDRPVRPDQPGYFFSIDPVLIAAV